MSIKKEAVKNKILELKGDLRKHIANKELYMTCEVFAYNWGLETTRLESQIDILESIIQ